MGRPWPAAAANSAPRASAALTSGGNDGILPFYDAGRTMLGKEGEPGAVPGTINIAGDGTIWVGFSGGGYSQSFSHDDGASVAGGAIDVSPLTPSLAALNSHGTMYVSSRDASPYGSGGERGLVVQAVNSIGVRVAAPFDAARQRRLGRGCPQLSDAHDCSSPLYLRAGCGPQHSHLSSPALPCSPPARLAHGRGGMVGALLPRA